MQARRIRPETGPIDRRRLAAAGLSAVLPGLGQLFNRRSRLAALFLAPSLILLIVFVLLWATQSPMQLVARAVAPQVMGALLTLNLLLLVWRLLAVGQGFLDTRWHGPTGRLGMIGIVVIAALVVVPHLLLYSYGTAAGRTFAQWFDETRPTGAGCLGHAGAGAERADQRPAARRRQPALAHRDPHGHDDGRLDRPGRARRSRCCPSRATSSTCRSATATSSGRRSTR